MGKPVLTIPRKATGPVAWCKTCSRYHHRRGCDLVTVTRIAKSGNKVKRWAHKKVTKKKTKARKS